MTIGIAAHGPNAGLAIYRALKAAEAVGQGSIGGFACFAAIHQQQRYWHQTQRGGTGTLFITGEQTGVEPPAEVALATSAALISSGPERPEPLSQFLAADPEVGLVTGHRLPNTPGDDGTPLNQHVLALLRQGLDCDNAVQQVLNAYPQADVGFIAVDRHGDLYRGNSVRVARRPDLGGAGRRDKQRGIAVEVLHNAIRPYPVLAELVAQIAFETMLGESPVSGWVRISQGMRVSQGEEHAIHCDADGTALQIITTDPQLMQGRQIGAAIYLHSAVYCDGEYLGRTQFEPNVTLVDGVIQVLSGQPGLNIPYGP